jgi:hypothetical protein
MIKKILDWILGKNDSGSTSIGQEAPYKVEQPAIMPVAEPTVPVVETAPIVETAPVTVKAKYKKAELNKMTKAQLMELVTKHSLEVKARSTKEELVKVLAKV